MNKKLIYILLCILILFISGCERKTIETPSISEPTEEPIDSIPSEPNEIDEDLFRYSFGFSSLSITNRNEVTEGYYEVSTEIEFLDALMQSDARIIEIKNNLNLGSKHVEARLLDDGLLLSTYRSVYRPHSRQPLLHPILLNEGIGQIRLISRENLMIYSKSGHTIKHTTFIIDGVKDLVIRNLSFTGIWEWDEETEGAYDRNDWDYFTVEKSDGIWFDHLSFDQAYDGIIDIKEEGQNITLSWSNLSFKPNDFIEAQMVHLEANIESYPYYQSIREKGITYEDMVIYASFQKKGFNFGNTTDGEGFESITVTFHHLLVENLMERLPRLRKGDVHLYHVILDNEDIFHLRLKYGANLNIGNQAIISTEGGAVLMEHSIFRYVSTPIRNHQNSNPDSKYTGSYQVINSELVMATRTYFGSSTDKITYWVHQNQNEAIEFSFRNHETVPYTYVLHDIYYLPQIFELYPPGPIDLNINWLHIES